MANVTFQIVKEADILTNQNVTIEGYITFTERGIYLGLGNNQKVYYDGISPNNFIQTRIVDTLPTTANENDIYINKTDNNIYIYENGNFVKLSQSLNTEATEIAEYLAGNNITITNNNDGTRTISSADTTLTGFNVATSIPTEFSDNLKNSLLFLI